MSWSTLKAQIKHHFQSLLFPVAEQTIQKSNSHHPKKTEELEQVCVFPLQNTVLFPGTVLPLHIFEERNKLMMEAVTKENMSLAMSLIKPNEGGGGTPSQICGAGLVNVLQIFPDGRRDIAVQGLKRLQIVDVIQKEPFVKAFARLIPDIPFDNTDEEARYLKELRQVVQQWIFSNPMLDDSYIDYIDVFHTPQALADFLAFYFLPTAVDKQKYLEKSNQKERVTDLIQFLKGRVTDLSQGEWLDHMIPPKDLLQ